MNSHSFSALATRRWLGPVLIVAGLIFALNQSMAAIKYVTGLVPDWNQPYRYPPPNGGPGADPNNPTPFSPTDQWNDWCAPTSAANLAGHWTDARGVPVADTVAFPGSTVAWGAGPSWQDYLADSNRPPVEVAAGALPVPTTDIGWYMDTNHGILYDNGFGIMGGYYFADAPHDGTYLKNIHLGLQNFLNSRYGLSASVYWRTGTRGIGWAGGVDPTGGVAQVHATEPSAFGEIVSEINTNRTLILSFRHWNILQSALSIPQTGTDTEQKFGGTYFTWGSTPGGSNAEDENWNFGDNGNALGHAVTCVGYITAGDPTYDKGPQLNIGATDWVIVHDNWFNTPRNVIIPLNYLNTWVANTTAVPWPTGAKFVKGLVPDWNQPYRYDPNAQPPPPNGGPGADPNAHVPLPSVDQWNAWCAPSSGANLAGHWRDYYGAPVADATAFDGSTQPWAAPSWQDYLADGTAGRPAPTNAPGLPPSPTDIGWYMDTNLGVPYDAGGGIMGGYFFGNLPHTGTYIKDMHVGLQNYLNTLFRPAGANWVTGTEGKGFAAGFNPTGGVAQTHLNPTTAFAEVKFEINRSHTLIVSFKHWNLSAAIAAFAGDGTNTEAAFGGTSYYFETSPGSSNSEDEEWNMEENGLGLGHAVTAVGYIPANDVLDPIGGTDWVIVHDNWASTPRNVVVPFDFANNWVANTIAYPDPGFLQITDIKLLSGTNAVVSFFGIPGALHDLLWKSDMMSNSWSTVVSNLPFNTSMRVTNTVSSADSKRFYRIKASY